MKDWVLVTGGTRGLGLGIAKALVSAGYHVVAAGRHCTTELEELCATSGNAAEYARLDLAETGSFYEFSKSFARLGPPYALVNNAAIARSGVLGTMHDSDIQAVINVNLTGTILLTKYISRLMLKKRRGRIVNIASIIGHTGYKGLSVYGATKAALNGFTYSLARELGSVNICVNSVAPGYMKTDMSAGLNEEQLNRIQQRSPLQRLVTVDEVAAAVLYLLSPSGGAVTGTVLTVDAGNTA